MTSWEVIVGDSLAVLADLAPESVDAMVCDPPYGLEFMGREWDRFRDVDRAARWSGERSGGAGSGVGEGSPVYAAARSRVAFGGQRPTTSRCVTCGRRDAFRNPHGCGDRSEWVTEPVDPHAAPPSMLAFQSWTREWARLALRVLKPGGHLLAFGGARTYHRMASGVEDAGFEVRDTIAWLYGSGFPKSLDVSAAIDKAAGATREVVGDKLDRPGYHLSEPGKVDGVLGGGHGLHVDPEARARAAQITAPATPDAERWQGWGTALKPAHEPVVVARKPLGGTVAANVLAYGTGALNVDGCRIGFAGAADEQESKGKNRHADFGSGPRRNRVYNGDERARGEHGNYDASGRWPANVVLDPEAAGTLDAQTAGLVGATSRTPSDAQGVTSFGSGNNLTIYGDSGGASRFMYCAKASSAERNALDLSYLPRARSARKRAQQDAADRWRHRARNRHPTVKPVELMRWLVRLVTPPGGLVCDPFAGSGTTGCAAMLERVRFLGVERDRGSAIFARARIAWWAEHPDGVELVRRLEAEQLREAVAAAGQEVLF